MNTFRYWYKSAQSRGASHIMVLYDGFDQELYPVEIRPGEDAQALYQKK